LTLKVVDAAGTHPIGERGQALAQLLAASARRTLLDDAPEAVHLHADQLSSIVLATGASGDVVGEQAFYATGEVRAATAFVDAYGFTGQERDTVSGMLHFAFRNLDPRTGRWDAPDPLFNVLSAESVQRLGESTSAYGYVANQPFDANDPTGLLSWAGVKASAAGVKASVKNWAATRVSPRTWWRQKQAAKRAERRARETARRLEVAETLDSILADPAETAALAAFTRSEFSPENLEFVVAARQIDAVMQGDLDNGVAVVVADAVEALVRDYVVAGSANQINIPHRVRHGITDAVTQAQTIADPIQRAQALTSALGPARIEIGALIRRDTLRRFRKAVEAGRF